MGKGCGVFNGRIFQNKLAYNHKHIIAIIRRILRSRSPLHTNIQMKKTILISALLLLTLAASGQPAFVKKHSLQLVPLPSIQTNGTAKMPTHYKGKWGDVLYTSKKKIIGFLVDSATNDTTYYQQEFKASPNAMRPFEPPPPATNDEIDPPQELMDLEAPHQMRMAESATASTKSISVLHVMPYGSIRMLGSEQAALDWIVARSIIGQQILDKAKQDMQYPIFKIHLFKNAQNIFDSIIADPKYPSGSKMNSLLYQTAIKFWQQGGNHTNLYFLEPLGGGGLCYRNPTLNRASAASVVNGWQYALPSMVPYDFTNYCGPHEFAGHGAGVRHTFNCTDLRTFDNFPVKKDSSYNEGPCTTISKPRKDGSILSYQHLMQMQGGGIVARFEAQEIIQAQNNLALSAAIPGVYLGAPTLYADSLLSTDSVIKLSLTTPANINATAWELWENGQKIQTGSCTQAALNKQIVLKRGNGSFRYMAWITGNNQRHFSDSGTVVVKLKVKPCIFDSTCINGVWAYSAKNPPCTGVPPVSKPCGVVNPCLTTDFEWKEENKVYSVKWSSAKEKFGLARYTTDTLSRIAAQSVRAINGPVNNWRVLTSSEKPNNAGAWYRWYIVEGGCPDLWIKPAFKAK